MPIKNGWLPREGFTSDPVGSFIKKTALNPVATLTLLLLARYTAKGRRLGVVHKSALERIKFLFYLGIARWVSGYLSDGALNSWQSDKYDWEKEVVVVTGGSGGIGSLVVKLLAEKGIKVVILDVQTPSFETPSNVYYYHCDVTSPTAIAATASQIRETIGEPTILVNNAGVAHGKTILSSTKKDIRFVFDVNTLAHYWLLKEFLPYMVKLNHGMVVTVTSAAAYATVSRMVDYGASKAAALTLHEGLTVELKTEYNAPRVRTVAVAPGHTRTPLFAQFINDSKFLAPTLEPETVAEAIVDQILSGRSGYVIVPGFLNTFRTLRGWPHWMSHYMRAAHRKWQGKNVINEDRYADKGGESEKVTLTNI